VTHFPFFLSFFLSFHYRCIFNLSLPINWHSKVNIGAPKWSLGIRAEDTGSLNGIAYIYIAMQISFLIEYNVFSKNIVKNCLSGLILNNIWGFQWMNKNIYFFWTVTPCTFVEIFRLSGAIGTEASSAMSLLRGITLQQKVILRVNIAHCRIWGSHSRGYIYFCLLGYNTVWFVESQQMFQKNISPPNIWLTFNGLKGDITWRIEIFNIAYWLLTSRNKRKTSSGLK
jgi:hypothetical protein